MFLFFFFFYYKHWLLTQQLYTLLIRLIHILTLFIILCILISILLKMQTVQHNHLRYQQYACSFMLLKTSYIKWGNCKIKSVHSVWFAIALSSLVWGSEILGCFQTKPCMNRHYDSVSWEARKDPLCAFEWRSTKPFGTYIFLITLTNFRKFLWTELSIWHFQ